MLCLDGAYGTDTFSEQYAQRALKSRVSKNLEGKGGANSLLKLSCNAAAVHEYQLLTDGEGWYFLHHAASDMKKNFPLLAAWHLYQQYISNQAVVPKERENDPVEDARQALADRGQEESETGAKTVAESGEGENVLDLVAAHKRGFLLGMVLQEADDLSGRRIGNGEVWSIERFCREPVQKYRRLAGMTRFWHWNMLINIFRIMQRRRTKIEHWRMSLNMWLEEKESDKENLEAVVRRILLTREAETWFTS